MKAIIPAPIYKHIYESPMTLISLTGLLSDLCVISRLVNPHNLWNNLQNFWEWSRPLPYKSLDGLANSVLRLWASELQPLQHFLVFSRADSRWLLYNFQKNALQSKNCYCFFFCLFEPNHPKPFCLVSYFQQKTKIVSTPLFVAHRVSKFNGFREKWGNKCPPGFYSSVISWNWRKI